MTKNLEKQFILGIGAQRTGSTWLRAQLHQCDQVNLGFCKEYHFFDVLYLPQMRAYHDLPEMGSGNIFQRMINEATSKRKSIADKTNRLTKFVQNPHRYFDYFDNLWAKNSNVTTVGDFTPSYSMLDRVAFEYARNELEKRGFRVKVVFIMRDPVERIWSMNHQEAKMKQALKAGHDLSKRQFSLESFTYEDAELRTRYERTIHELEQVFDTRDIYCDFYERYISKDRFKVLTKFLCLKCEDPDVLNVRNASHMKGNIETTLAAEVANYYKSTYDFVEARFGKEVCSLWTGYEYI